MQAESGPVKDGWFTELSTLWPGQGLSLKVKEILFQERSEFQVYILFDMYLRACPLVCCPACCSLALDEELDVQVLHKAQAAQLNTGHRY